jgi:creatinine amidohydrolase
MFPDELEAAFAACPVVYFSYGLCEPHGPHCTVGLDAIKAHEICRRTAETHGGIVAPPDYWHIHEVGRYAMWAEQNAGEARPWLTAVPPWVHFKNVCYHLRAADALGFHAAILLTGHYGPNWMDLKRLTELLQPHFAMRLFGLPDFEANQPGFRGGGDGGDHAGKVETSLLWALAPECVDFSRLPPPDAPGPHFAMGGNARESDRRAGEAMVADEVAWLGKKAAEMLEEYARHAPVERTPMTFARMEEIWRDDILPHVDGFASMNPRADDNPAGPALDSRWRLNWKAPKAV